ncbi:MAG TPA: PPC domain-containing DNA-binding protein [Trueperaceae bacterium]
MRGKLLTEDEERTHALVFDSGELVTEALTEYVRRRSISAARLTAIGAFSHARLGYFDLESREYQPIVVDEQVELLSLIGDVALWEGEPLLHAHVVVGRRDGSTAGGHLLEARVRPTLEVLMVESPRHLQRRHDPTTGLPLLDPR